MIKHMLLKRDTDVLSKWTGEELTSQEPCFHWFWLWLQLFGFEIFQLFEIKKVKRRAFKIPDFRVTCHKACSKAKVIFLEGIQLVIHRLQTGRAQTDFFMATI